VTGQDLGIGYAKGTVVLDRRTGKRGTVVDRDGYALLLRPLGGGREWKCSHKDAVLAPSAGKAQR